MGVPGRAPWLWGDGSPQPARARDQPQRDSRKKGASVADEKNLKGSYGSLERRRGLFDKEAEHDGRRGEEHFVEESQLDGQELPCAGEEEDDCEQVAGCLNPLFLPAENGVREVEHLKEHQEALEKEDPLIRSTVRHELKAEDGGAGSWALS